MVSHQPGEATAQEVLARVAADEWSGFQGVSRDQYEQLDQQKPSAGHETKSKLDQVMSGLPVHILDNPAWRSSLANCVPASRPSEALVCGRATGLRSWTQGDAFGNRFGEQVQISRAGQPYEATVDRPRYAPNIHTLDRPYHLRERFGAPRGTPDGLHPITVYPGVLREPPLAVMDRVTSQNDLSLIHI